jgi:hypothetical protein
VPTDRSRRSIRDIPICRCRWFGYGVKAGIPRPLEPWDAKRIKIISHMVVQAVARHPQLPHDIVGRGYEAVGHGKTGTPEY